AEIKTQSTPAPGGPRHHRGGGHGRLNIYGKRRGRNRAPLPQTENPLPRPRRADYGAASGRLFYGDAQPGGIDDREKYHAKTGALAGTTGNADRKRLAGLNRQCNYFFAST